MDHVIVLESMTRLRRPIFWGNTRALARDTCQLVNLLLQYFINLIFDEFRFEIGRPELLNEKNAFPRRIGSLPHFFRIFGDDFSRMFRNFGRHVKPQWGKDRQNHQRVSHFSFVVLRENVNFWRYFGISFLKFFLENSTLEFLTTIYNYSVWFFV